MQALLPVKGLALLLSLNSIARAETRPQHAHGMTLTPSLPCPPKVTGPGAQLRGGAATGSKANPEP